MLDTKFADDPLLEKQNLVKKFSENIPGIILLKDYWVGLTLKIYKF